MFNGNRVSRERAMRTSLYPMQETMSVSFSLVVKNEKLPLLSDEHPCVLLFMRTEVYGSGSFVSASVILPNSRICDVAFCALALTAKNIAIIYI